jgi:hypothetical protein
LGNQDPRALRVQQGLQVCPDFLVVVVVLEEMALKENQELRVTVVT